MFYVKLASAKKQREDRKGLSGAQIAGIGATGLGAGALADRMILKSYDDDSGFSNLVDRLSGYAQKVEDLEPRYDLFDEEVGNYNLDVHKADELERKQDLYFESLNDPNKFDKPEYNPYVDDLTVQRTDSDMLEHLNNTLPERREGLERRLKAFIEEGDRIKDLRIKGRRMGRFAGVGSAAGLGALGTAGLMRMYNNRKNSEE